METDVAKTRRKQRFFLLVGWHQEHIMGMSVTLDLSPGLKAAFCVLNSYINFWDVMIQLPLLHKK